MQEVHISKSVKLLDSPGVVALASNPAASMALRSLQVEEGQESVLEAVRALLKQCDQIQVRKAAITRGARQGAGRPQRNVLLIFSGHLLFMFQIMLQYNVPNFRNSLEFLSLLAKKRGYLQKGGVPNVEEAAAAFLADCTG